MDRMRRDIHKLAAPRRTFGFPVHDDIHASFQNDDRLFFAFGAVLSDRFLRPENDVSGSHAVRAGNAGEQTLIPLLPSERNHLDPWAFHRACLLISAPIKPAPKPLLTFTTDTFGLQLLSMVKSGATPLKFAP